MSSDSLTWCACSAEWAAVKSRTHQNKLRARLVSIVHLGAQMLQPLAIAVIGGILISMVLSLIITPVMHFYLTKPRRAAG